ncbi:MAG: hypothetical protein Q8N77_03175 [Nanoarchaeota archaeon]|nr:hypothetical protein [Nanoarchaeota archaeon]
MENDLKSKMEELKSTIDKVIEEAMRNIRPEDIVVDLGKMKEVIKKYEGIGREERIAKLVANLISAYGNLVVYTSSIDESYRQEQVSVFLKIREDAEKYLGEAKEFDYLPTIKILSDTLADEVEKRKKPPVTIYHEAYL